MTLHQRAAAIAMMLKGITGGGTFRELFSARPIEPGTSQGCRRDWGRYTLP